MEPLEVLTTGIGGGVSVAVVGFLAKNLPEWWRHRGEQAAAKAVAEAKNQELAFELLTRSAQRVDADVTRLSAQMAEQQAQINEQQDQIEELQGTNSALAEENRVFRKVVLGIVHRLEVLAAWVREGHQPPPPYTTDQLLEFIRESLPDLRKDPS